MDPIADMLTIIKNGQAVSRKTVSLPCSKLKLSIAELLSKKGWLGKVDVHGRKTKKVIEIELKYKNGRPIIASLKKISKPGRRIYAKKDAIPSIKSGFGAAVISTSQGVMTDRQAAKKGLGGELICEIY